MDTFTTEFLSGAKAGKTAFLPDVRNAYRNLKTNESFACDLIWEKIDGGQKTFRLRLPRFLSYPEEGRNFVREFFLAQIYNILCAMGGRRAVMTNPDGAPEAEALAAEFERRFQIGLGKDARKGYGRFLNVVDRMLRILSPDAAGQGFSLTLKKAGEEHLAPSCLPPTSRAADIFRQAATGLEGKTLLGIDIGGTDIKLALAVNGRLTALKEFDWHPALFTHSEELIQPILILTGLMGLAATAGTATCREAARETIAKAMRRETGVDDLRAATERLREEFGVAGTLFDAIGVSFPDVVVADAIVGGESPKTRGMRDAFGDGYEPEFAKITGLAARFAPFIKPDGRVGIVNDGPMAAFTAGVEMAAATPEQVERGVFAHTLGTDLGTGWVNEKGAIPDIPLEAYGFIIDLGSLPEREFPPDDVRSVNNFNSGLPGSPQKYASQSGVFRLAVKYFAESRHSLLNEIRDAGFLAEHDGKGQTGLFVPTSPRDMRKPFLEFMTTLTERKKEQVVDRVFKEVGAALAAVSEEIDWILAPAARKRFLFGRLVKTASCFKLIARGAAEAGSRLDFIAADKELAETPLMKTLSGNPDFTVAQFAQAVGAIYYANHRLNGTA